MNIPTSRPISLEPILTGEMLITKIGEKQTNIVIDLDSLVFSGDSVLIDYNHDENEIIGNARVADLRVDENGFHGLGTLIPIEPGDRADTVGKLMEQGCRFGLSPSLDLKSATVVDYGDGETFLANYGKTFTGPAKFLQNVPLLGISVCPYPTDRGSDVTVLKNSGIIKLFNTEGRTTTMENENIADTASEETVETNVSLTINTGDLAKAVELFGAEETVRFLIEGKNLEEVIGAMELLKNHGFTRLSEGDKQDDKEPPATGEKENKPEDESLKLKSELLKLNAKVDKIMGSMKTGEEEPIQSIPKDIVKNTKNGTGLRSFSDGVRSAIVKHR